MYNYDNTISYAIYDIFKKLYSYFTMLTIFYKEITNLWVENHYHDFFFLLQTINHLLPFIKQGIKVITNANT